jgi:hypothetical protein
MALFTVAEARAFDRQQLANTTTYPDAAITAGEARIREDFTRICGVAFEPTTTTVVLDGARGPLLLPYPLVTAVTAVEERASGSASWTALGTVGTDYLYGDAGVLTYEVGTFPRGTRNVRVTFTHGYAAVPGPIKRAALLVLIDQLVPSNLDPRATAQVNELGSFRLAVAGGRIGGERNWYGIPEVDRVLNTYRFTGVGVG